MLPPGPRQPSALQLFHFVRRPLEFLEEAAARHGDPFTMRLPGYDPFVVVAAPELIKQIFNGDDAILHAGKANQILEPLVGMNSVILLDGAPHLAQRRLLSPPMRGERMHAYADLIREIAEREVAKMPRDRPFALHPHMQAITLDVILRAVFGVEGAEMHALRAHVLAVLEPPPAIVSFVPPKYMDFPLSPFRAFKKKRAAFARAVRAVVRARRDQPRREDILSLLLATEMTDDELVDELITMLVAGHETTATALSWTFACLLEHPEIEARLRDGGDDYLDAVIKETLRLRPVVPDVVRKLLVPMRFAGYDLPAGVHLTPCIHLAHRRAGSYPEPTRFRPERFLGVKPDPYAWLPFGGGIRRCLGMAFALYEMKLVLQVVMEKLRFELAAPGTVRVIRRSVTLAPEHGTRVRVRRGADAAS